MTAITTATTTTTNKLWFVIQSLLVVSIFLPTQQHLHITVRATTMTTRSISRLLFQQQSPVVVWRSNTCVNRRRRIRRRRRVEDHHSGFQQPVQEILRYASTSNNSNSNSNNNSNINNNDNDNRNENIDLSMLEGHILSSVQSQIDRTRVLQALSVDEPLMRYSDNNPQYTNYNNQNRNHDSSQKNDNTNQKQYYNYNYNNGSYRSPSPSKITQSSSSSSLLPTNPISDLLYDYETSPSPPTPYDLSLPRTRLLRPISTFQISIAAAIVCGTIAEIVFHNTFIATIISISIFLSAFLDDDPDHHWHQDSSNSRNNNYSALTGALARILGRTTIRSVQASEPKIKAIARVVITGEEDIQHLQQTIQILQRENDTLRQENQQLQQWKQTHILIYQHLFPKYTLVQLKDMAKLHQLPVSGTKLELMERLLDANVLQLPNEGE